VARRRKTINTQQFITAKFKLGKLNHAWITDTLTELKQIDSRWTFDDLKKMRQLLKVAPFEEVQLHPKISVSARRKFNQLQAKGML